MSILSKIINSIKDTISPKYCYSCKKEGQFLCPACLQKIHRQKPYCYVCKQENNCFDIHKRCQKYVFFDKIIVYCHYRDNLIKKLIKDAKFYNRQEILNDFGQVLSKIFLENEEIKNKEDFLIIPTPMYFFRKLKRGYNHSEILAKKISKDTNIQILNSLIKKQKNTKQQSKLTKKERETNLKDSFKINKKYLNLIIGKNIVLVDDVVSTGTTLNEISGLLKQNGVKKVIGLVIASD